MKLEVPVGIYPTSKDKIMVVGGGNYDLVDFPVRPYQYVTDDEQGSDSKYYHLIGGGEAYIKSLEYEFIPVDQKPDGTKSPKIDYALELVKDYPEEVRGLVEKPYLPYPIFMDIETDSTGGHFSRKELDEIISIQYKYPDCEPTLLTQSNMYDEGDILVQFLEAIRISPTGKVPDFMVGYNLNRFDIPYLKERIKRAKMRNVSGIHEAHDALSRTDYEILYPSWVKSKKNKKMIRGKRSARVTDIDMVRGFVTLDLYLHAKDDHVLRKLPSRSLENVARAYGATDVVDMDKADKTRMREIMEREPEKFRAYAIDDVVQCEYLYNIYAQRLIASANLLTCPMIMIHHASSGQKSYIALYRESKKHKFHSVSKNKDRYVGLYERAEKYQGALVACYNTGYFPNTVYIDCKSMYPNIMHDYNVSFDRYKLEDIIDYDENHELYQGGTTWKQEMDAIGLDLLEPELIALGDTRDKTVYVPDDNYRVVLKLRMNLEDDGFMRTMINHYNNVRDKYKKLSKEAYKEYAADNNEQTRITAMMYESMQQEAKVLNNTFYGVLAQKYYEVADLPAAMFVTAMGRWIMGSMIEYVGDAVIEVDTDGILLNRDKFSKDIVEINRYLKLIQHEAFGVPIDKMRFEVEFEGAGSVYMYRQKNYVLRKDEDGEKLTVKGSSFVGYDKAPVIKRAVEIMSQAVMSVGQYGKLEYQEAKKLACNIRNLPLHYFKFSKTLKRNPEDYVGYEGIYSTVMQEAKEDQDEDTNLKAMKAAATRYITKLFKNNHSEEGAAQKRNLKNLVKSCSSSEQLQLVLRIIASATPSKANKGVQKTQTRHFLMDIILKLQQKGMTPEEDDMIEYYYTRTSEQYTLAEDLVDSSLVNYEKYETEINNICERFSLADPIIEDLSFDIL